MRRGARSRDMLIPSSSPDIAIPPVGGRGATVTGFGRACQGVPARREAQESQSAAPLGHQPRIALSRSIVAAGARTDRPTSTPDAPARHAASTWRWNVTSSTPPDKRTHGSRLASFSAAQASPTRRIVDRRVIGKLGLEDVPPERRQPACRLDDAVAASSAGELSPVAGSEPAGPRTGAGRPHDTPRRRPPRTAPGRTAFAASWW